MNNNVPQRKSSRDLAAFAEAARAAAEADGVAPASVNLPKFSSASPENIAKALAPTAPAASDTPVSGVRTTPDGDVIGEVVVVKLDLVDPNPQNSREGYLEDEIVTMMSELGRAGKQLQPITLERSGDRFLCLDGYTRVQALRQMGKDVADAIVIDPISPWERYKWSFRVNNVNRHTTDYDNGVRWRELIDQGITTQQQITAELGLSHSTSVVSRVMSVTKFPERIREFVAQNKIRLTYNFYYSAYSSYAEMLENGIEDAEQKILSFLQSALDDDISYREMLERLDKLAKGEENKNDSSQPANQKKPNVAPLMVGGKKVGALKEWASGKVVLTFANLPEAGREELKTSIEQILERYKA